MDNLSSEALSNLTKCLTSSSEQFTNGTLDEVSASTEALNSSLNILNSCFDGLLLNATVSSEQSKSTSSSRPFVPPLWLQALWIVVFASMVTAAVLGNASVIYIILAHRRMRSVTNVFLLNLSFADAAMAMFNALFNFAFMITSNWPFGRFYCAFSNFLANLTVACSVFTITATSVDRYVAVVHPLKPRMSKKSTFWVLVFIWISSAGLSSPTAYFSKMFTYSYADGQTRSICTIMWPDGPPGFSFYDYVYNLVFLALTYVIPMAVMAVTYGLMGRVLWSSEGIGEISAAQLESIKAKRKVVRMLICVTVIFAICWLPYHIYFLYTYHRMEVMRLEWVQHLYLFIYFLAMSNSACNPIIYALLNKRFRTYFTNMFFCRRDDNGAQCTLPNGHRRSTRTFVTRDARNECSEHTMVTLNVQNRRRTKADLQEESVML